MLLLYPNSPFAAQVAFSRHLPDVGTTNPHAEANAQLLKIQDEIAKAEATIAKLRADAFKIIKNHHEIVAYSGNWTKEEIDEAIDLEIQLSER